MTTTHVPADRAASVDLALVAALAALIAVCSILPALNVSTFAPITLQTFGVLLAGALLGAVATLLARRSGTPSPAPLFAGGLVAVVLIHAAGILGLHLRADLSWSAAVAVDAAFWFGDVLKLVATVIVAAAVHRTFPWLLRRDA